MPFQAVDNICGAGSGIAWVKNILAA